MEKIIRIAGVSGSLRSGSYNTALLKTAATLLPSNAVLDIMPIHHIPHYNQDLDLPAAPARPAEVNALRAAFAKASAILIVSPEYNYSIPGPLKNAIDWLSRGTDSPIFNKPVSLMGVTDGNWGTVRMQQAFYPVFTALNMQHIKPEVLVAKGAERFDAQGNLTDAITREIVRKNLAALTQAVASS